MKIAILSDVHSNWAALRTFPEEYDQLWCVGDLVDYGPRPSEVIAEIRKKASVIVSGNHDSAVGHYTDPQCSAPFRRLAAETLQYTRSVCAEEELEFLRNLPRHREVGMGETRFYIVHATPTGSLYAYCPEDSGRWIDEAAQIQADVLVVGHTHMPFIRRAGRTTIVNPGSLGQPKTGLARACYAVWEDGEISLREYEYPVEETIRDIRGMPLSPEDQDALISVLKTGKLPG